MLQNRPNDERIGVVWVGWATVLPMLARLLDPFVLDVVRVLVLHWLTWMV